jgi:hypothetical protein
MPLYLRPAVFQVDHLGPYRGFLDSRQAERRVLFSFEVAFNMAIDYAHRVPEEHDKTYEARYDAEEDAFCFYEPAENRWLSWTGERRGEARLYPIGEDAWTWLEVG